MNIEKYLKKENYITSRPWPDEWRNHPNGSIILYYSAFIKGTVLDFGCNHGACTFLICENENVKNVFGFDINEEALNVAKEIKKKLKFNNIDFICGNFTEYDFKYSFNTIITFHALEHIFPEDLPEVIKKFYDILEYDGYVIVSIPNNHCFDDKFQHVNYFNVSTLRKTFEDFKFLTIECLEDGRWSEGCILTGIFKKIKF